MQCSAAQKAVQQAAQKASAHKAITVVPNMPLSLSDTQNPHSIIVINQTAKSKKMTGFLFTHFTWLWC